MAHSDFDLIQGCRRGDTQAWERVLEQYERLVFSIPLNYGLSGEDAADITQVTFTIFMQSVETLRDDSRLAPWLATVARRHTWRLLHRRRRESVAPEADLADVPLLHGTTDPRQLDERLATVEWLNQGLNLLKDKCRRLLLALYFDPAEPSYHEIAIALNIAIGSIGPTRARCLATLKQRLEEAERSADGSD